MYHVPSGRVSFVRRSTIILTSLLFAPWWALDAAAQVVRDPMGELSLDLASLGRLCILRPENLRDETACGAVPAQSMPSPADEITNHLVFAFGAEPSNEGLLVTVTRDDVPALDDVSRERLTALRDGFPAEIIKRYSVKVSEEHREPTRLLRGIPVTSVAIETETDSKHMRFTVMFAAARTAIYGILIVYPAGRDRSIEQALFDTLSIGQPARLVSEADETRNKWIGVATGIGVILLALSVREWQRRQREAKTNNALRQ
jgi:hypothetical protein